MTSAGEGRRRRGWRRVVGEHEGDGGEQRGRRTRLATLPRPAVGCLLQPHVGLRALAQRDVGERHRLGDTLESSLRENAYFDRMRRRCSSLNTIIWSVHSRRVDPIKRQCWRGPSGKVVPL